MAIPSTAARLGMSAVDRKPRYAVAGASLAEAVEVVEWTADIAMLRSTL
ncbi:hypothetical protein [Xanthomonas arboricola]